MQNLVLPHMADSLPQIAFKVHGTVQGTPPLEQITLVYPRSSELKLT